MVTASKKQMLFKVAWMSVVLGVGMEILILCVAAGFGKNQTVQSIIADTVQKVSWASFVCIGVAVGSAASKSRVPFMGLMGFLAAPIAFHIARVLHKSVSHALSVAGPVASVPSVLTLSIMKALEYAALGVLLGLVADKKKFGLRVYLFIGLCVGLVFGGAILYMFVTQSPQTPPTFALVSRGINEIIFPVGCAFVLYAAHRFLSTEE